jgi:hypothetical protein
VAIPLHFEGWTHVTRAPTSYAPPFAANGVADRLRLPGRGETV